MFVYVTDVSGRNIFLNTHHIAKCTQRQDERWSIKLVDGSTMSITKDEFHTLAQAIENQIAG